MQRILLAGPAAEPVLLTEAKAHLRVDGAAEDELIGGLIVAARMGVETATRRMLIAQSWRLHLTRWARMGLPLPIQPVLVVDAVRAFDAAGAASVLAPAAYEVNVSRTEILLLAPSGARRYEVDLTAGYGSSGLAVPQPLRLAMLMLIAHWYENRGAVLVGSAAEAMPEGFRELIAPYRRMALC